MAELPNLTTSNVGWIAYYNVVDNTDVTESDLTDGTVEENGDGPAEIETMISDSDNENIDYYNNGVIVTYEGPTRIVTIRFKTDGWITAHMDRTKNYQIQQGGYAGIDGVADIVSWNQDVSYTNSSDHVSESSLVNNTLERSINTALSQMSIYSGKISGNYDPNDVELYNYEFETNNATLLSDTKYATNTTHRYDFLYTDATEVQHVSIAVSQSGDSSNDNDYVSIKTGSNVTILTNPDNEGHWAMYDATQKFNNLSSGEPFNIEAKVGDNYGGHEMSLHIVVVWS